MRKMWVVLVVCFMSFGMTGCGSSGSDSGGGTSGDFSTASRSSVIAVGSETCENGGILIESGIDENGNGVLDASEVDNTDAVCNGDPIVWLGEFATAPTEPSLNDAYYNQTLNTSYIWDGVEWDILVTGGDGSSVPAEYVDPVEDEPEVIPAEDRELITSGSVSVDSIDPSLVSINVAGLIDPDTGLPYEDLTETNFVVVEDGVVQGFTIEKISDSITTSRADITFIVDTTGSMGGEISGVKDSIVDFLAYLESKSLDVQVGGVAYADAVVEGVDFSSDTSATGSFKSWVDGLTSCYGGECGGDGPENGLDPIAYAMDNFTYRSGAQKLFVLLTDITLHQAGDGTTFTDWTVDSLVADKLAGVATVHVVSPSTITASGGVADAKDLATKTGGSWVDMGSSGTVDLTSLPIASVIAAGYRITFMTDYTEGDHTVRVVYTVDVKDGEFEVTATY